MESYFEFDKQYRAITAKYEEINSKLVMPTTIQISHAISDGYHVSMFFKNLQDEMNQK